MDGQGEHGGKHQADEDQAEPVHSGDGFLCAGGNIIEPAGIDAQGTHQAAGAHTGRDGSAVHFHPEDAGGDGTGDGGGQGRRDPDPGILHDVAHLEHGGAEPLGNQAADFVFLKGDDREADHLRAAAGNRRAAGQTGQS